LRRVERENDAIYRILLLRKNKAVKVSGVFKMKNSVSLGKKQLWICMLTLLFSLYCVNFVSAAVSVTSIQMEQGKLLVATIPQFESGMDAGFLGKYNETYRQIVLTAFSKFEKAGFEIRTSSQLPEHMKNALTFHAGYEVFRNDLQFVSLAQKIYQYTGGAHGISWLTASTINLQTGRTYKLSDLFAEGADYSERLGEVVRREGAKRKLPLWGFKEVRPDSAFYLTDEGVMLFFQPYEIAPYSEGIVRIFISYRDLADILQPEVGR